MSHTQLIKDTLNILDLNIYFEENCLTKEKYKGQICLIYKGTLLYKPEECPIVFVSSPLGSFVGGRQPFGCY